MFADIASKTCQDDIGPRDPRRIASCEVRDFVFSPKRRKNVVGVESSNGQEIERCEGYEVAMGD